MRNNIRGNLLIITQCHIPKKLSADAKKSLSAYSKIIGTNVHNGGGAAFQVFLSAFWDKVVGVLISKKRQYIVIYNALPLIIKLLLNFFQLFQLRHQEFSTRYQISFTNFNFFKPQSVKKCVRGGFFSRHYAN